MPVPVVYGQPGGVVPEHRFTAAQVVGHLDSSVLYTQSQKVGRPVRPSGPQYDPGECGGPESHVDVQVSVGDPTHWKRNGKKNQNR